MPNCEQFIYTTASTTDKSGYQVIAQSSSITSSIISKMSGYFFPSGIDPSNIDEYYSMLVFEDDIIFSKIKNIGVGFDGRNNTLYNHSFVMRKEDFSKIDNDSRIFLKYSIKNSSAQKTLEKINIGEQSSTQYILEFVDHWPRTILEFVYDSIFKGEKIALVGIKDNDFIQNLLSVLPKSLRLLSFSTLVFDPKKQSHFNIIQLSTESQLDENHNYRIIDITKLAPVYTNDTDTVYERSIKFYVELIKNKELDSIKSINSTFDEITESNSVDKLKLLTYFDRMKTTSDEALKHKFALDIFKILDDFDIQTIGKILPDIQKFIPEDMYHEHSLKLEISHLVQSARNNPIDFYNITSLFSQLSTENSETRNMLLNTIVKTRFDDLIKSGTQLLLDFRYSGLYRDDILKVFIDNVKLHDCVVSVFTKRNDIPKFDIQAFFERILEKSINLNQFLTLDLLKLPVFDFNERWETENYRKIIENVFKNKKFNQLDYVNNLIDLSEILHNRILDITEFKSKSGTSGTTKSNIKQFIIILDLFLKYFTAILEEVTCTPNQVTKIKECISKLDEYMKNYKSYSESGPRYWWQRF